VRDAHVREFDCTVIEDCCAAYSDRLHRSSIDDLRSVAQIQTIADVMRALA
jgi:nicotinamidase-related amidase